MRESINKIENIEQLIDWFKTGCKKKSDWLVGTEHEKFAYTYSKKEKKYIPLTYYGKKGINTFLEEISKHGWDRIYEQKNIIALKKDSQSITLEPGGQIELSGAPLRDLHSTCRETNEHLNLVKKVGKKLNVILVGLGVRPNEELSEVSLMPKARYKIMRKYMPTRGTKGLEMMHSTCTVQANLDYETEIDMINKVNLSVKIQPIVTALFANSPFYKGLYNGFESYRKHIWNHTDPDRCGILKIGLRDDFGFRSYIKFALSIPMYFIVRNGKYLDCTGKSFKDFLDGKLDIVLGEKPTIEDWENHLSTIFTEVRLKKFIEVRGADAGNWRRTCALPAFWVGLLYGKKSISSANSICNNWSLKDIEKLSLDVAKKGLNAQVKGEKVHNLALELIKICKDTLEERSVLDSFGTNEAIYLQVLEETLTKGHSPAKELIKSFENQYEKDFNLLIEDIAY